MHIQYSKKKKAIEIDKSIEKSTNDQAHKKYTIDFITDGIFFQLDQKIYTCKRLICFLKINENILQTTPKFFVLNDDTLLFGQSTRLHTLIKLTQLMKSRPNSLLQGGHPYLFDSRDEA